MASLKGTFPFLSALRYMKILKYTMTGSSREFYGTGTNFFRYRYRYFFPGPIFSGTGTIQKGAKFPGPGIPGTGMSHSGVPHWLRNFALVAKNV